MGLGEKTLMVSQIPLFASLPASGIRLLTRTLTEQTFPSDVLLLREGDEGDRFYIVLEGHLEIIKGLGTDEEKLLYVRGPGDFIGEMSFFLASGLRTASVRTRTPVTLLEITREVFEALLHRFPGIAVEMARTLSRRLRDADNARILEMRRRRRQAARVLSALQATLLRIHKDDTERDSRRIESIRLLSEFARFQKELISEDVVADAHHKVIEVKQAIHRSVVPRLAIQTFGTFQIYKDEVLMAENAWQAIQPKLLLKAIIAHRPHGVPKDVLIEALWPEVSPLSGERNFKVILHRLRKSLEPQMDRAFGSSYLHLKANLLFVDEELCHIDLDDFLTFCQQGYKKREEGDFKSAIALFKQAVELYTGDFLAEDLYAPWAEAKRNELRDRCLGVLFHLAELLERQGHLKSANDYYQKVLRIDPTLEAAYQRLMGNYANRGMRNSVLKTYDDCVRILRQELNTDPDTLTTSLYRKALESA